MTADTSFYYDESFAFQPTYRFNDSPTTPNDSPWTAVSLLPDCSPIQSIPCTMNPTFSAPGFAPGQEKYFRERDRDTHLSLNPGAPPVQQESFYPHQPNWQQQQNMWTYNSNGEVISPNVYPAVASYDYELYNQQWAHGAQNTYVQPQHPMVQRTMNQNSVRYQRYPVQPSMPTLTSPLYHSSPATVTLSSPAMSETAIPSPPSGQWPSAVSTSEAVSPQQPETSTYAQANDALDLPFRQQQLYFTKATTLPAENWTGPFIPQYIYRPHTNSDRKRYVEEVTLSNPLYFQMEGPQEYGIPLSDALHSRVKRLAGRDIPVFEGRGPSVSIRLEWPGYRPWTRQIPTKDFRSPPCPITMAKLAKAVAKCVQRFIEENKDRNLDEGTDRKWKVGGRLHDIKLEDVVLVSLHHVSLGSWQPQLRLRRPKL